MELSTAQQALVVILSTALAIFLILSIIIAAMVIQLLTTLRKLADRAEHVVQSAENVGEIIKNVVTPMTVLKFGHSIFDLVSRHAKRSKDK
jgi:uncharacterized metal-binding protein